MSVVRKHRLHVFKLISEESESGPCMSHAKPRRGFFGGEEGPRGTTTHPTFIFGSDGSKGSGGGWGQAPRHSCTLRNVTVAVFLFFLDGQCEREHQHAGTGAGRQEHAATDSAGRLDQEPRSARQNRRTKVSLCEAYSTV